MKPIDVTNVSLIGLIADKDDYFLIKKLAAMMKECDYSTTQREDAREILSNTKMDGQQVLYRLDNLEEFIKQLNKEVKRIRKDVREEFKLFS